MSGEKKRSVALERRVQVYLKPTNHIYFSALAQVNGMGESEAMNVIVRDYFTRMPQQDRERILQQSKNRY